MIEVTLLNYLADNLEVPVYMEYPEIKDSSFVVLEKTGSSNINHINRATFAIQSVAQSLYESALLNEKVKALMNNAISLDGISRSSLNSDYNFTDASTKMYRYQCVYDLTHY